MWILLQRSADPHGDPHTFFCVVFFVLRSGRLDGVDGRFRNRNHETTISFERLGPFLLDTRWFSSSYIRRLCLEYSPVSRSLRFLSFGVVIRCGRRMGGSGRSTPPLRLFHQASAAFLSFLSRTLFPCVFIREPRIVPLVTVRSPSPWRIPHAINRDTVSMCKNISHIRPLTGFSVFLDAGTMLPCSSACIYTS